MNEIWLTWLIFFPLLGAVILMMMPAASGRAVRLWATVVAVAEVAFSLPLWWRFVPGQGGWQFEEHRPWLPGLGATYHIGVDGVSVLLVLLTTLLTAVAVVGAYGSV